MQQFRDTLYWLKTKLNVRYIIEGSDSRKEKWEIPEIALKEAIINALSHRDYYDKGARTMVELFDDRLEIKSPGQLPESIDVHHVKGTVLINPVVAAIFHLYQHIERAGTGIEVAQEALKNHGLKPARIENVHSPKMVQVTIFRNRHNPPVSNKRKGFFGRILEGFRHVFS